MATTTMTPLEAIAYLHGTLPKNPELYEDDDHTAALIALAPLVGAHRAEPLFTAEFEEADGDKVTLWLSGQSFELAEGQQVDVYPHGSRPAPRKVTAEDVFHVFRNCDFRWPGNAKVSDRQELADAINAILAGDTPEG